MTFSEKIALNTKGFSDVIDITSEVVSILERSGAKNGLRHH